MKCLSAVSGGRLDSLAFSELFLAGPPAAEFCVLSAASSEFVFIDSHRRQAVQISNDPALRHQFQRNLVFQTRRPIDGNLQQLPGLKRLFRGEKQPLLLMFNVSLVATPERNGCSSA